MHAFGADAVDKVECPPGWRLPGGNPSRFSGVIVLVNDGIGLLKLALRLTNFLSESVGRRLMLSSPKVWENRAFGTLERPLPVSVLFASREGRQNSTPSSNARRPATRRFLEGARIFRRQALIATRRDDLLACRLESLKRVSTSEMPYGAHPC